eukprot:COSAG02_NODE_778_length_17288_cov_102.024725_8_plen_138_part_00
MTGGESEQKKTPVTIVRTTATLPYTSMPAFCTIHCHPPMQITATSLAGIPRVCEGGRAPYQLAWSWLVLAGGSVLFLCFACTRISVALAGRVACTRGCWLFVCPLVAVRRVDVLRARADHGLPGRREDHAGQSHPLR